MGQADLEAILKEVGFFTKPEIITSIASGDDAGIIRLSDELALIQTVDVFTAVVDDPRQYGRIAAANSLSDVYAMGGRPVTCLAIMAIPAKDFPAWAASEMLTGANEVAAEADAPIVGGHSLKLPEPAFGLAVTGIAHPDKIIGADAAQPGDAIVLTKPLGSGIITTAGMSEKAPAKALDAAIAVMSHLNRSASEAMLTLSRTAATDVTGFGMLGHLLHILEGSQVGARIELASVPLMQGAMELATGFVPGGTAMNYEFAGAFTDFGAADFAQKMLLCDAQTSGGLLIACPNDELGELMAIMGEKGEQPAVIGQITERSEHLVTIV
ncbi:selenide, water dikinase SelD [bacterium]|nr:selenide, water dikinase SelD [bacterium]